MNQIIIHASSMSIWTLSTPLDDPSLRVKPLIIGALPNERGVVATCSYEARKFGVHSGMSIKDAYRLCPRGIYRHPDFDKYRAVSHQLREIWRSYAAAMETIALDEAYLDVTEQAGNWEGAREIAQLIKRRTREELHLSCSVGLAYSKTAAKTASEEKKPDGYFEILSPKAFTDLIADRDVQVLYTVGEKTAQKLHAAGIRTVRDVQQRQEEVIRLLGKQGRWVTQIAFGIDDRSVTPYRPEDAKSIGREITFQEDVGDYAFLKEVLFLLALNVENRVRRVGLHGKGVTLKLTYANMKSITRSRILEDCDDAVTIYRETEKLLEQVENKPVRLIGVSVYNLSGEEERQMSFGELLGEATIDRAAEQKRLLAELQNHYHLDFEGHLEQLYHTQTLHRTVEYMRRHQ